MKSLVYSLMFVIGACGFTFAFARTADDKKGDEKPYTHIQKNVTVSVSKTEVRVGEKFYLREMLPATVNEKFDFPKSNDPPPDVVDVEHTVTTIGDYSDDSGFFNWPLNLYAESHPNIMFDGILVRALDGPIVDSSPNRPYAWDYNITTPRSVGFELEVRSEEPGIYLVFTTWKLKDRKLVTGGPALLFVRPAQEKKPDDPK